MIQICSLFLTSNLQDNEFYYLVVTAVNSSGNESGYSNEAMYESSSTVVIYMIASSSGSNGSITPLGTTIATQGVNQTYSISPDANYHIKDVQFDGVSIGTFSAHKLSTVSADHTISASFDINTHVITASSGLHGSISPTGNLVVIHGSSLKFSLTVAATGNLQARDACIVNVVSQNTPPISYAGPDETVTVGSSVTLDGSGSYDSDDGIVLYLWEQISGTPVTLSDSTAIQPTFTALRATEESAPLELLLTVKDEGGLQSSDLCIVSVTPIIQAAPVKIHSGDLNGKKTEGSRGRWNAVVTITVHDESEQAVGGVLVTGHWSAGISGSDQCTTGTAGPGQCEI